MTTETFGWLRAQDAPAEMRSLKLVELASTKMMLALGASAWAHSTSSDSSNSQPPVESTAVGGVPPVCDTFVNFGGSGRPNAKSNLARSLELKFTSELFTSFGSSKASMIAIV